MSEGFAVSIRESAFLTRLVLLPASVVVIAACAWFFGADGPETALVAAVTEPPRVLPADVPSDPSDAVVSTMIRAPASAVVETNVAPAENVDDAVVPADARPLPSFLPPELHGVAVDIIDQYEQYVDSEGLAKFGLALTLLSESVAVIACAQGRGPVPVDSLQHGDLSRTGQHGVWSFHLNGRTFHFNDYEFPEYGEYIVQRRSAMNEDGTELDPAATVVLSDRLAETIRLRAEEALSYLGR